MTNEITVTAKERTFLEVAAQMSWNYDNAEDEKADNATIFKLEELVEHSKMNLKSLKGVAGSLTKKGLICETEEPNTGNLALSFTDEGIDMVGSFDAEKADDANVPAPAAFTASDAEVEVKVEKAVRKGRTPFSKPAAKEATPVKAGSKRAEIAAALIKGATYDDMRKICIKESGEPWSKGATRAACTTFWTQRGFGIEQRGDKFHMILPTGMKSPIA